MRQPVTNIEKFHQQKNKKNKNKNMETFYFRAVQQVTGIGEISVKISE